MVADLVLGRLARSLNKCTSPFRWMGCKLALVEFRQSREVGSKGRKVRPSRRGKRRGSRGSGSLKRRAKARSDPKPDTTTSSQPLGILAPSSRKDRANQYSQRLIDKIKSLSAVRSKLGRDLRYRTGKHQERYEKLSRLIKDKRRAWVRLAHARSTDPPQLIRIRLEVLLVGIDTAFERVARAKKVEDTSLTIVQAANPDVGSWTNPGDTNNQPVKTGKFCHKCQVTAVGNICRRCGGALTKSIQQKSESERKRVKGRFRSTPWCPHGVHSWQCNTCAPPLPDSREKS